MRLIEVLQENESKLSEKGRSAMARAVREVFPTLNDPQVPDTVVVGRALVYDIADEDCLKILELTARYAGLWAFA